jgi:hypothetical protein
MTKEEVSQFTQGITFPIENPSYIGVDFGDGMELFDPVSSVGVQTINDVEWIVLGQVGDTLWRFRLDAVESLFTGEYERETLKNLLDNPKKK